MSRSALSARVFAVYLFILGALLALVPNALLPLFGLAPTPEVWVRIVGVLSFNIGIYVWVSAGHRPFLEASVYTRLVVFTVLNAFVFAGLVSPVIILFGVIDLSGAAWTWFALRADARAAATTRPSLSEALS